MVFLATFSMIDIVEGNAPCSDFQLIDPDSDATEGGVRMKIKFRSPLKQSTVSEYRIYEMMKFGNDVRKISTEPIARIQPRKPRYPMEGGTSKTKITSTFYQAGFASQYDMVKIVRDGAAGEAYEGKIREKTCIRTSVL